MYNKYVHVYIYTYVQQMNEVIHLLPVRDNRKKRRFTFHLDLLTSY